MSNRKEQIKIANFLQEVLGDHYTVRYDDCESGLTRVYYRPLNIMTAEVPNSEMHAGISTAPYLASKNAIMEALARNLI